jgi:hypothetical protein
MERLKSLCNGAGRTQSTVDAVKSQLRQLPYEVINSVASRSSPLTGTLTSLTAQPSKTLSLMESEFAKPMVLCPSYSAIEPHSFSSTVTKSTLKSLSRHYFYLKS